MWVIRLILFKKSKLLSFKIIDLNLLSSHYYLSDVLFYCKSMIFRWLSPEHRTSKYEQLLIIKQIVGKLSAK